MDTEIILNFGDSQGEIWDYVFFNNENYIKFQENDNIGWRSGWSNRGLKKIEHKKRLFDELEKISKIKKKFVIILTFGSTDIEWNLSYKRFLKKEFPNTEIFISEMINNLLFVINNYFEIEKNNNLDIQIIVCFPYLPLPLSNDYMKDFSEKTNTIYYDVISHNERITLWNNYCDNFIKIISTNPLYIKKKNLHIFDLRNIFIEKGFDYFLRKDYEDHHPNLAISHIELTKILNKYIFYDKNNKPFKIKYNNWKSSDMYNHIRRPLS